MSLMKFFAASVAFLAALAASPATYAHATYSIGTNAGNPVWLNGVPAATAWADPSANIPSIGYIGIHGLTANNKRVIQTGTYDSAANLSTALLGGVYAGITPVYKDSLLGQLYNYNAANPSAPLTTTQSISVTQNSWAGGVYDSSTNTFNQGLLYGNIHASAGSTGNPEAGLMALGANFLNITVGDDNLFSGANELAFSIYQGFATGPGLSGLNLLGTVLASSVGQDIGISVALTGNALNGAIAAGEYTIVAGDQSGSLAGFDGHIKLGIEASATALYANQVAAVPVPGAVWLFGSALAGFAGFNRRKQAMA